jgi:ketosteroid isomerase-like protein
MVNVREAIAQGDLTAFESVLAPDIVWVGLWPGQICRNRDEVLEMLKAAQAGGIAPSPEIVRDDGDRFVVDPHLPVDERHQVFVLRDDGVVSEVRAYPDRAAALAAMEPPW